MKTQLELNVSGRGAMSGVLTMGSLDPAFAAAVEVDGGPVVVDLRTVEFVEPAGLCGLAALLEFLCGRCEDVSLELPGRDVPAYLERMNFFRIFGDRIGTNADVESLEERRRHNPGTLQELINFHTEEEIPGIIRRISEILENQGYRLRERVAICSTLSEVCANAAEHGISSFGAYAAVQAYHHIVSGSRRRGEEVLIAIADGGVGVRETLSRNPKYAEETATDNEALRHALEMGVSGTGSRRTRTSSPWKNAAGTIPARSRSLSTSTTRRRYRASSTGSRRSWRTRATACANASPSAPPSPRSARTPPSTASLRLGPSRPFRPTTTLSAAPVAAGKRSS